MLSCDYPLFIKQNIYLQVPYHETDNQNRKQAVFNGVISCDGEEVKVNKEISEKGFLLKDDLKLSDQENNDRAYVEEVIDQCIYHKDTIPLVGFKNTLEKHIILTPQDIQDITFLPGATISLILEPDLVSKISIYLGWLVYWLGFLLLIGGVWKILKR